MIQFEKSESSTTLAGCMPSTCPLPIVLHGAHLPLASFLHRVHNCHEDWLEIYNLYYDNSTDLIGRFCENSTPGPTESLHAARGLRVILHTDSQHVSSGFKAKYTYLNAKELFGGELGGGGGAEVREGNGWGCAWVENSRNARGCFSTAGRSA